MNSDDTKPNEKTAEPAKVSNPAVEIGEAKASGADVDQSAAVTHKLEESKTTENKVDEKKLDGKRINEKKVIIPGPIKRSMDERRFRQVTRRELLKVAPILALGAFAVPGAQEWLLKKGLGVSDWASRKMFRRGHLATTFSNSELTPFEKFPINGYDVEDPGVIFENWTLTVTGAVQKPGDYKLQQIQTLPLQRQNTRHVCVEGWDVIGRFGGTRLSNFLNLIGADTAAKFITVKCADDYYESLDMATALHPQTLLCWEMYERPLTREHGAPLRLNIPTKVGYKQAKYLTDLSVTNVLDKVGYWEDQGYSEFYGL
jgi:DMSO/TMAO reductase YedYZ molybdopterin-dependent catalytic subunit